MYQVFLGLMPLPIAPSKITTAVGTRSKTVELLDGSEVNIIKGAKLQEISFEFLLPSQDYPFATMAGSLAGSLLGPLNIMGAVTTTAFLEYLESLKESKEAVNFICVRLGEGVSVTGLWDTNIQVVLEDYTIIEDANNGMDYTVQIKLKEYKPYRSASYDDNGNRTGTRS